MRPEDPRGPTPTSGPPKLSYIVALLVGSVAVVVGPFLTWIAAPGDLLNGRAVRLDAFDIPLAWLFKWPWSKVAMCQTPSTLKLGHALLACGIVGVIVALIGLVLWVPQPRPSADLRTRTKAWKAAGLVGEIFLTLVLVLLLDLLFQFMAWGSAAGRDLMSHPGLWVAGIGGIVGSSAPRAGRKARTRRRSAQ